MSALEVLCEALDDIGRVFILPVTSFARYVDMPGGIVWPCYKWAYISNLTLTLVIQRTDVRCFELCLFCHVLIPQEE